MTQFPFTCRDDHEEIGFRVEPPNGDERCPLCYLRDLVLLELAQPRTGDVVEFCYQLSSLALRSYPYHAQE